MENQEINTKNINKIGSAAFVGCMFIGMAAGYFFNHLLIGLFAGMGVGFLLMAAIHYFKK